MNTNVVKLAITALPTQGPSLVVTILDVSKTITARYVQATSAAGPFPEGQPLVAIIRIEPLATPDRLQVAHTERDGSTFKISLQRRRFTGTLLANVVTVALIEVELGPLARGTYRVTVSETVLEFRDLHHPESAGNPGQLSVTSCVLRSP
jgi:hypothetical protein